MTCSPTFGPKAGIALPGVEMRIVDEEGRELPWDDKATGQVEVRGPWIASGYYNSEEGAESQFSDDGWLRTGDVGTIDPLGYMRLVDRTKDLIKSGGEWISSVELENKIMGHPAVAEAAVIAVPHPKWMERPLACVVLSPWCHARQGRAGRVPHRGRCHQMGSARRRGVRRGVAEDERRQVLEADAAREVR